MFNLPLTPYQRSMLLSVSLQRILSNAAHIGAVVDSLKLGDDDLQTSARTLWQDCEDISALADIIWSHAQEQARKTV